MQEQCQEKASTAGNKPAQGAYDRTAEFTNILNDYEGSASIIEARIKGLNNSYFNDNTFTSTSNNMKSVAYMLDTKAWSGFATDKADYAIGGPTVELLFKSYNQKYTTNYIAEATSSTGYMIGENGIVNTYSFYLTSDPLYIITSNANAYAYWLASPNANNSGSIDSMLYNRWSRICKL